MASLDRGRYNMKVTRKQILASALGLPPADRASLARQIIASLDGPPDAGAGEAWAEEIERRAASVRERKVRLVDWKRARERLRKAIQKPPQ